jgi:hypothetical protein
MISIPAAAHCELFEWQLDLFWFCHRQIYGQDAKSRACALVVKRNDPSVPKSHHMTWRMEVPHVMCEAFFDIPIMEYSSVALPINIQVGLAQILPQLDDEMLLEVIDCDMIHFRPCPLLRVGDNELLVSTAYEDWHLHSRTYNRHVIEPYFENGGRFYNGGFVPIIGKVSTFKRIMHEWIAVHIDILRRPLNASLHWWAGMFALQAACEKARVHMINENCCYIPGVNELLPEHYIGHYSVDSIFDKRLFPNVNLQGVGLNNPYYRLIKEWLDARRRA